jgi:hypothetical protein
LIQSEPAKAKTPSDLTPQIAKRAYELYERQGHRDGQASQDWLVQGRLGGNSWNCVTYNCPFCFSVLSVGIDPVALKADTVAEVVRALKGH